MHEGKTLGQIAHEAGERAGHWARKWSDLGESQRAEWEEIGAAVACATIPAAAEGSLSMRVALEQISALCPAYSGEYAATVTPSDFGGNADDFSREQGLMQAAAIGDIARAALAAPKAEAWQPIETAPKDGTWVLLYTASGIVEGCWSYGAWVNGPIYCTYDGAGGPAFESRPTHWMPIPPGPTSPAPQEESHD